MTRTEEKKKYLGQYFSGNAIANLIHRYIPVTNKWKVIDPMCGVGDLLKPFYNDGASIEGTEVDKSLFPTLINSFPNGKFKNLNSFSSEALTIDWLNGYDLVITNPPYIRYQLQGKSKEILSDKWMPLSEIIRNLTKACTLFNTISDKEKQIVIEALQGIPGIADIAIPSWILCMLLVKPEGYLAIVLPDAWLSREYANPVKKLLCKLFEIEYFFTDNDRIWFQNKAQVKTSVIICKRKQGASSSHIFTKVEFRRSAASDGNIIGAINDADLRFEKDGDFGKYKVGHFEQKVLLPVNKWPHFSSHSITLLNDFLNVSNEGFVKVSELNINCGQGLRTGANEFFYISKPNFILDDAIMHYLYRVIQNQKDLGNQFTIDDHNLSKYLLYIQDAVIPEDRPKEKCWFKHYNILPEEIISYIHKYEKITKNGITIPELSSVKTNVRRPLKGSLPRFWYMLPQLMPRHTGTIIIPRVNGGCPFIRFNPKHLVVDANFVTCWTSPFNQDKEFAMLAVFNSKWFKLQMEEIGTIMGGGALKIDAVQLKKILLPANIEEGLRTFSNLGMKLSKTSINNCNCVINNIDKELLKLIGVNDPSKVEELESMYRKVLKERGVK